MTICKRCDQDRGDQFYKNDRTCKECRKAMVRKNRAEKAEYYRAYDRERFKNDPKVAERHRRYQSTEAGKQSINRAHAKWKAGNPDRYACHNAVNNAVRDGKLVKPDSCEKCGASGVKIHGHHDDYSKPLDVRWLCPACHVEWHRNNDND